MPVINSFLFMVESGPNCFEIDDGVILSLKDWPQASVYSAGKTHYGDWVRYRTLDRKFLREAWCFLNYRLDFELAYPGAYHIVVSKTSANPSPKSIEQDEVLLLLT